LVSLSTAIGEHALTDLVNHGFRPVLQVLDTVQPSSFPPALDGLPVCITLWVTDGQTRTMLSLHQTLRDRVKELRNFCLVELHNYTAVNISQGQGCLVAYDLEIVDNENEEVHHIEALESLSLAVLPSPSSPLFIGSGRGSPSMSSHSKKLRGEAEAEAGGGGVGGSSSTAAQMWAVAVAALRRGERRSRSSRRSRFGHRLCCFAGQGGAGGGE